MVVTSYKLDSHSLLKKKTNWNEKKWYNMILWFRVYLSFILFQSYVCFFQLCFQTCYFLKVNKNKINFITLKLRAIWFLWFHAIQINPLASLLSDCSNLTGYHNIPKNEHRKFEVQYRIKSCVHEKSQTISKMNNNKRFKMAHIKSMKALNKHYTKTKLKCQ